MDLKELQLVQAQKRANELIGINQRLSEELRKAQDKIKKLEEQLKTIEVDDCNWYMGP